ncbi:hypothetical protein [Gelidibacter sp. F63206]|uniref:hypothetical protein n=1 Tax=Gelidibacter sp. F63206 TaxID=2926425 RepID=UPI001FF4600D|nr:hypothetical protein [Gelidibacter sp. F63206]MCK0114390.1 hypothetical protein [Gelidibacter sp. F63206]
MRNLFILTAVISIVLMACDGRQTKKEALERAISEFKLRNSVLEVVNYQPEAYVEIVTDTIISNRTNVHVKNYSLLDEQIFVSSTTNANFNEVTYQRVFESEIIVSMASKDIFRTHISAKQFKLRDADLFWNDVTLQHVWVNQELSTDDDIILDMSFINPKNNAYRLYRMSIDPYGRESVNLIEERG